MHIVTVQLPLRPECVDAFLQELHTFRVLVEAEQEVVWICCKFFEAAQNGENYSQTLS